MPCHDAQADAEDADNREKVQTLTQLLCTACKTMAAEWVPHPWPAKLEAWWEEHQKSDGHERGVE